MTDYESSGLKAKFATWLGSPEAALPPSAWQSALLESIVSDGKATFTDLQDGSWLASGNNPATDIYTFVTTSKESQLTGLKLEALSHESFPNKGPGRGFNGNIALSKIRISATPVAGGKDDPVDGRVGDAGEVVAACVGGGHIFI